MAGPEVTHETLDAVAAGTAGRRAAERLRGLLTAAGTLPYRDSAMRRYEQRVAEILSSVPADSRMAVRQYARWAVTRPLQARAADGEGPSADLIKWPLARIRAAAQFTAGLAEAGQPLAAVTQSHLDAWTAELPAFAPALRGFVNWAAAHGYMAASLEIPWRDSREDRRGMDDEERLALAQRLMRTLEGEPRDRLGAILILLFGQHVTRLARLKASAVSLDADGKVHIALGDTPVRLREPLAHLAVTVADDARRAGSQWLFPGENGPMSSDRFRDRLAAVGVTSILMARNSALAAFAADVPPALLADKLGLSISAAVEWSKAVAAARADYAGLRNGHSPAARKRSQALLSYASESWALPSKLRHAGQGTAGDGASRASLSLTTDSYFLLLRPRRICTHGGRSAAAFSSPGPTATCRCGPSSAARRSSGDVSAAPVGDWPLGENRNASAASARLTSHPGTRLPSCSTAALPYRW